MRYIYIYIYILYGGIENRSEGEREKALAVDNRFKSLLIDCRHVVSSGVVGDVKNTFRACPTIIGRGKEIMGSRRQIFSRPTPPSALVSTSVSTDCTLPKTWT